MEYYDNTPVDFLDDRSNDSSNMLKDPKSLDQGYNKIWGFVERADGSLKKAKIEVYTSGGIGSNIRDAETGEYYKEIVGSKDENLYFKMKMATGELKSSNGSITLFYTSPDHCMRHLHCDIPSSIINNWNHTSGQQQIIKNANKRQTHVLVK